MGRTGASGPLSGRSVRIDPTDPTPFGILVSVTSDVCAHLRIGPFRIDRIAANRPYWGRTNRRSWIAYADPAPLAVVAHELAHITTQEREHTVRWSDEMRRLWPIVAHARAARYRTGQRHGQAAAERA